MSKTVPLDPRGSRRSVVVTRLFAALCVSIACSPAIAQQEWEPWGTETYRLEAGESFQFRIAYEQIPVRNWRLVVDGDYVLSDLHVLRVRNDQAIYLERSEGRHDVAIPWGHAEEIAVTLTAAGDGGVYTVRLMGPAAETSPASYSYDVNRALEAYAAGDKLAAEQLCEQAIAADEGDAVARVLLAGFLRDRHFYEKAGNMIDDALAGELPEEMHALALQLRSELAELRPPLPPEIRVGLIAAEGHLADGRSDEALNECDRLLADPEKLTAIAHARILNCRGQALHKLGRHFEAVDAFTRALAFSRSRENQALIYYRMGWLFRDMDNLSQAEGALSIARQYGLPAGLDLQAAELLKRIAKSK